ncbi:MAG: right-handed parallel beta-helix repeat-containing protein, partial [Planctomycetota bacterium]
RPMRTPAAAYERLRDGKPDWLLFRAGDTFRGNLGTLDKSGRSKSEPQLIGVYGDGDRPLFLSPSGTWAGNGFSDRVRHLAIVGLRVVAEKRDPTRSGFNSANNGSDVWKANGVRFLGDDEDILIEDCIFEYFLFGMVFQSDENNGFLRDVRVRRSAVLNSYGHWNGSIAGHSSGIFTRYVNGMLIEECVLDHNGWNRRVSGASRTKFNHNIYVQRDSQNMTVRGNIIARAASHGTQLRSGGDIENNLYVSNALALYVARNRSNVTRNVVMKSDDLGNGADDLRGFGIITLPCLDVRIENNILSQKQGSAGHAGAIDITWTQGASDWVDGRGYNVHIRNNKIHRWNRNGNNAIDIETGSARIQANTGNQLDRESGGDNDPPWIDPERDVESYMESIGRPASLDALIEAAAYRPRGQWAEAFTAEAVNQYIRRGFDVRPFD